MKKSILGIKQTAITVAILVSSLPVYAQVQEAEVETLRQELQDMRALLDQYVQQISITPNVVLPATTQPNQNTKHAKANVLKSGAEVDLYGYIRADALYQAEGATTMYNYINGVPLEDTPDALKQKDQFRSTAAATRLGLNFKVPTEHGNVGGKVEMDFFGGSTRDQFRIRHAYLTYGNWLVGQTWSNFIAPEYLPETVDAATYVGGSLQRTPLIKYADKISDKTNFAISIEDPKYSAATDPDNEMRLPALVGRVNHKFDGGSILSGRAFVAEKKTSQDESIAWGVGLGSKYQINPQIMLKADYYHVKGDGRFLLWTNSGYALDADEQMHDNEFDTVSLGLTHQFTPKLRSTLGYGYMVAKDDNTFAKLKHNDVTQNKELWQTWINAVYNPVKPIDLGIEYVYGERETFDGRNGVDNRINMMAIYHF